MLPQLDRFLNSLSTVFDRDGINFLAALVCMRFQIIQRDVASKILHHFHECCSSLAFVESLLTLLSQPSKCPRKILIAEDLARHWRSYMVFGVSIIFQHLPEVGARLPDDGLRVLPYDTADTGHGKPILTQLNSWLQDIGHLEFAASKFLDSIYPSGRSTRNSDRVNGPKRHVSILAVRYTNLFPQLSQ